MLLRFRVVNYASIRDELELSMVAVNDHPDLATRYVKQADVTVLPVAAIYGANASGKSNIVDALVFMRSVILRSHQNWRPDAPINRRPFKLDTEMRDRPTTLTVDFIVDDIRYEYGFSLDDSRILREWLYSFPKKRPRLFFERSEGSPMKFGPSLKGLRQNMAKLMRPNSLYLSAAAANNHPQLTKIYRWFAYRIMPVKASADLENSYTIHEWQDHDRKSLRDLLTFADTGVVDLEVEEEEISVNVAEKFREFMKVYSPEDADTAELGKSLNVEFVHRGAQDSVRLLMDEESSGTLAWVRLIGPVIATLRHGSLMVVDELDAYLHSLLSEHLVGIFQDPKSNPLGAQLLFNTHDVTLLSPSAPGRLLRDQVWLAEKGEDGVTKLIPLTAYRVRDGLENVEKRYLSGRYGAIPFFDDNKLESLQG